MARTPLTYSIVARDPAAGLLGIAVQSHWFSVGSVVSWGEAGVGVVVTQAFAEPAYGPRGLALMREGVPASQALATLVAADPASNVRQVAFLDVRGGISTHTGEKCLRFASHRVGRDCSAQANMMLRPTVPAAMVAAYEKATGDLADRMLAAMHAAEGEKGDIRGRQSAAMLVVKGNASDRPWADRPVELRVEDHADPLGELGRLLRLNRAYNHMNAGDGALERGDKEAAFSQYAAAAALAGDNIEIRFWHGLLLAGNGRIDDARPILRAVFEANPNWRELLARLPESGIVSAELAAKLMA